MERYRNLGGDSGVYAFEIGDDSITIEFNDGAIYLYNSASAGSSNIEQMKKLARRGNGLIDLLTQLLESAMLQKLDRFIIIDAGFLSARKQL